MTNLVESVEFGSGTQSLCILAKEYLRRGCSIDHYHRYVAELNLINGAISPSPLPVFLRSIDPNLSQISKHG